MRSNYEIEQALRKKILRLFEDIDDYFNPSGPPVPPDYDPYEAMADDIVFEVMLELDDEIEKAWQYEDLCD